MPCAGISMVSTDLPHLNRKHMPIDPRLCPTPLEAATMADYVAAHGQHSIANGIRLLSARVARLETALRKIRGHNRASSDFLAAEEMTEIATKALQGSQP